MKYIFRGIVVFEYNPATREMVIPKGEYAYRNNFNFCSFIPEDYLLISEFFKKAHLHATNQIKTEDLKDVEVG